MRKFFAIEIVVFLLVFFGACTVEFLPTLSFTDADSSIIVKVGQHFTITLEENPSTGYMWEDPEISDTEVVKLVSSPKVDDPSEPELVGAPTKVKWEFEALEVGTATIVFKYKRPWEEDVLETKIFSVEVK